MSKESIVINGGDLFKENRYFDALLKVDFGAVIKLWRAKVVFDLFPWHFVTTQVSGRRSGRRGGGGQDDFEFCETAVFVTPVSSTYKFVV